MGFQIPRFAENFVEVVRSHAPTLVLKRTKCAPRFVSYGSALGIDEMCTSLQVNDRTVGVGAHPVGIDTERVREILRRPESIEAVERVRTELRGRKCVVSVERLDYVKGQLEKLDAFERLLEDHPELHGKVELVNIVTPAAPGIRIYRSVREDVDRAVGRINGRFGRLDWAPVRYFFRAVPFEDVLAYLANADVAWIAPLRDGLNLVAKEFVAAQTEVEKTGMLLLSEYAGAAVELHGALLTNPYHAAQMKNDLHRALTMDATERAERMRRLSEIVLHHDVRRWGEGFLDAVARSTEA